MLSRHSEGTKENTFFFQTLQKKMVVVSGIVLVFICAQNWHYWDLCLSEDQLVCLFHGGIFIQFKYNIQFTNLAALIWRK